MLKGRLNKSIRKGKNTGENFKYPLTYTHRCIFHSTFHAFISTISRRRDSLQKYGKTWDYEIEGFLCRYSRHDITWRFKYRWGRNLANRIFWIFRQIHQPTPLLSHYLVKGEIRQKGDFSIDIWNRREVLFPQKAISTLLTCRRFCDIVKHVRKKDPIRFCVLNTYLRYWW